MTTQERIEKIERMIKAMKRDGMSAAESCGDYEAGKGIYQTAECALELLFNLRAELEPEVIEEMPIAA
jgi:hypothetical protein